MLSSTKRSYKRQLALSRQMHNLQTRNLYITLSLVPCKLSSYSYVSFPIVVPLANCNTISCCYCANMTLVFINFNLDTLYLSKSTSLDCAQSQKLWLRRSTLSQHSRHSCYRIVRQAQPVQGDCSRTTVDVFARVMTLEQSYPQYTTRGATRIYWHNR